MALVTMLFHARAENVDTGEVIADPELLTQLDGVVEDTDFGEHMEETEDFPFAVGALSPVLNFDEAEGLVLEIVFSLDATVTPAIRFQLYQYWLSQVEGTWGLNYAFDLPDGFDEIQIHFDEEPIEPIEDPSAIA